LAHFVVADRTDGKALPLWADEGMAMLADPAEKQARHARDLANVMGSRTEFNAAELLSLEGYPEQDGWAAFYGQSHALVAYLMRKDALLRQVHLLETAERSSYDEALREHYGIDGADSLRSAWRTLPSRKYESIVQLMPIQPRLLDAVGSQQRATPTSDSVFLQVPTLAD